VAEVVVVVDLEQVEPERVYPDGQVQVPVVVVVWEQVDPDRV
jgi:hypothetical protein